MSRSSCLEFVEQVRNDTAIQNQLRDIETRESFQQRFVELGSASGHSFTTEEAGEVLDGMLQSSGSRRDLAEEDLAAVSAGSVTLEYLVLLTYAAPQRESESGGVRR